MPNRALLLRGVAALTAAALLATACGSTVPVESQQALLDGGAASDTAVAAGDGLGVNGTTGTQGNAGGSGSVGSAGVTGGTADAGSTAGATLGGGTTGTASGQQPRAPGPQPKAAGSGPLTLGLVVPSGDPARAFGFDTRSEDYGKIANALIDDLNERGGLAGRKVKAVVRESSQDDQSEEAQTRQGNEICQSLTQDEQVDLVAAAGNSGAFYAISCYANARTPILMPGNALDDQMMTQYAPWLLPPFAQNMTSVAASLPGALRDRGVMTRKIGILAFEMPQSKRVVEGTFKPAIERNGGKVLQTVYMSVGYQDVSAGVSSAVLQFKSQGIDLVLPSFASGGGVPAVFMHEAETQNYRPRYGLSSMDAPIIIDSVANAPAAQLANAIGFGHWPALDVEQSEMATTSNERRCWNIVNKRLGTRYSDRNFGDGQGMAALDLCELLWLLEAALAPWKGQAFDPARVHAAMGALGRSYTPVSLPASHFAPRRPDGSAVNRQFRFDASGCSCFTYRGGWRPIRR